MSDPCKNKLLKRIPSPDGTQVLSIYDRQCPQTVITMVTLERPPAFLEKSGENLCYVTQWSGSHPVAATWKDANKILISTTDRLQKSDFYESKETCNGIKIEYTIQFRNETQKTDDPEVIAKIRKALADIEPCITKYYQAAYAKNDPAGEVRKMIDSEQHRSAVENIMGYAYSASCPITPETYQTFKELSETFDLKPGYLERVAPLVKQ